MDFIKLFFGQYWRVLLIATVLISAPSTFIVLQNNKETRIAEEQFSPTIRSTIDNLEPTASTQSSTASFVQPTNTTTSGSATQKTSAQTSPSSAGLSSSTPVASSSTSSTLAPTTTDSNADVPPPTLYVPYSTNSNLPSAMTPMGETLYHPKPQNPNGHPGIDFQWENPSAIPTIIASMNATVYAIVNNTNHAGTYDVSTKNGKWGVDYAELGSVASGVKVGDSVNAGDIIGTPQHPASITDLPNFRMIHWQFGYASNNSVGTRLCPISYFASSAKTAIETLWANTNSPEIKSQFPNICSGDYAEN